MNGGFYLEDIEGYKKFIQQHINLSTKFLDTYLRLTNQHDDNAFTIDLDEVATWIDKSTKSLKKRLKTETQFKPTDYLIKDKKVYISSRTFKHLLLSSETEMGDEAVKYFLEMDKIMLKYQDDIINTMTKNKLEHYRNMFAGKNKHI